MTYTKKTMKSPVGDLTLVASSPDEKNWKLSAVLWKNETRFKKKFIEVAAAQTLALAFLTDVQEQLEGYFKNDRKSFQLPLRIEGTDFQKKIWAALLKVPFGQTISYGELAKRAGYEGAYRATGATVGMNPCSIIIPCHRVIGSNGHLTGFAGGLKSKVYLLTHEGFTDTRLHKKIITSRFKFQTGSHNS